MKYIEALKASRFFRDISASNIERIIHHLGAVFEEYAKGQTLFYERDIVNDIGILLKGTARSVKTDADGKLVTVTLIRPGNYIGVLLAASHERRSPVSVQALEEIAVLFIPIDNILSRGDCIEHAKLLSNLIDGIAEKALMLHERNDCLIKPTIRAKVLTYLNAVEKETGARSFTIPFNREGLAEYLNVDRSALSRELSSMKRDGLIDYHKSRFKLLY